MEVTVMLGDGIPPKTVARVLSISLKTVEYHWAKAKQMFGLRRYVDACKLCVKYGLITL